MKKILILALLNCVVSSLDAMSAHLTTNRDPIDSQIKQQLMRIILKNPADLAVSEEFSKKIPSIKAQKQDEPDVYVRNLAYGMHLKADSLMDLIDETIESLKKQKSDFVAPDFNKEKIFDNLASYFDLGLTYKDYMKARRKIPFVNYMQECQCLHRRIYPFRAMTEQRIIDHLVKNKISTDATVVITEFASGDLFELFIIANLLIEKGYRKLRLIGLDLKYTGLIGRYFALLKPTSPLKISSQFSIPSVAINEGFPWSYKTKGLRSIEKKHKKEIWAENELAGIGTIFQHLSSLSQGKQSHEEFMSAIHDAFETMPDFESYGFIGEYQLHKTIHQFLRWFADDKNNKIELVLYSDARKYIDECKKFDELKSDIIFALDWFPDVNFDWWDDLRKSALKKNGLAITVLENLELVGSKDESEDEEIFFLAEGDTSNLKLYEFYKETTKSKDYKLKQISQTPKFYVTTYEDEEKKDEHGNTIAVEQKEVKTIRVIKEQQPMHQFANSLIDISQTAQKK